MAAADDLTKARNEAFRRIGRNVFFFQRMEGMLKVLDAVSQFQIDQEDLAALKEGVMPELKLSKSSMGLVKESALNKIYTDSDDDTEESLMENIFAKMSFKVEATRGEIEKHHQNLKSLIEERNCLIHTTLVRIDPNSAEDWLDLSENLDQQRLRILPEMERLRLLIRGFQEIGAETMEYMNSDSFLAEFNAQLDR